MRIETLRASRAFATSGQLSNGMSPFWQVLAGGLHSRARGSYCSFDGRCFAEEFSVSYFALQPGVGVTVMVTQRFGIRTQADVQFGILIRENGKACQFFREWLQAASFDWEAGDRKRSAATSLCDFHCFSVSCIERIWQEARSR